MRGFEDHPADWAPATLWFDEDRQQWQQTLEFLVPGQPIQQGNMITGRYGNLYDKTAGLRPWREMVSAQAHTAMTGRYRLRDPSHTGPLILTMFTTAVMLDVTFVRKRPTGMPKTKPTPPHTVYPDLDKLVRAICDSLTGIVYCDDKQVVDTHSRKRYAEPGETPGALILVTSNVEVKAR